MAPSPVTRNKPGTQTEVSSDLKRYLETMKKEIIAAFQEELGRVRQTLNSLGSKVQKIEESLQEVHSEIQRIDDEINGIKESISENN